MVNLKLFTTVLAAFGLSTLYADEQTLWSCTENDLGQWVCGEEETFEFTSSTSTTQLYLADTPLADALGWTSVATNLNICGGYYQDSPFPYVPPGDIIIDYNLATLPQNDTLTFSGAVTIMEPDQILNADLAYANLDPDTGQLRYLDAHGQVVLRQPGYLVIADSGAYDIVSRKWFVKDAIYRFPLNPEALAYGPGVKHARGAALHIEQNAPGVTIFRSGNYTTCQPDSNTWQLKGSRLTLNQNTGWGSVRNARLHIKGIPVFYWPYYSFPIDDRRKTGLLDPIFSYSDRSGLQLGIPLYLNFAPNIDSTITGNHYTKRGSQLVTELRYLTPRFNGIVGMSFLPNDSAFSRFQRQAAGKYPNSPTLKELQEASTDRLALHYKGNMQLHPQIRANLTYNYVSDDYYSQDFGDTVIDNNSNQLLQEGSVTFSSLHWRTNAKMQRYQTLRPVNEDDVDRQYKLYPQLSVVGTYPKQYLGLNYQVYSEFSNFLHDDHNRTTGERLHINTSIKRPFRKPGWFVTPGIDIYATRYIKENKAKGTSGNVQRFLPILSLDNGLIFERSINWGGTFYQQTLEPRLFYLFAPDRNQSDIPIFSTVLPRFSYDSLFRNNRFSGLDRIGDANQISYAVTTRFINSETAQERLRLNVGFIHYFSDRKVTICSSSHCIAKEDPNFNQPISPIAGELRYRIKENWHLNADTAWNAMKGRFDSGNIAFEYAPNAENLFSIGYIFIRDNSQTSNETGQIRDNEYNQLTTSMAFPLKPRWYLFGHWRYNINLDNAHQLIAGIDYESCCWGVRIAASRTLVATLKGDNTFDNAVYIQFALKGLGSIGNNDPRGILQEYMPNYSNRFGER